MKVKIKFTSERLIQSLITVPVTRQPFHWVWFVSEKSLCISSERERNKGKIASQLHSNFDIKLRKELESLDYAWMVNSVVISRYTMNVCAHGQVPCTLPDVTCSL